MKEECKSWLFETYICSECAGSVVGICNNTALEKFEFDDWIAYCTNKECVNHEGQGYFQELPNFMVKV